MAVWQNKEKDTKSRVQAELEAGRVAGVPGCSLKDAEEDLRRDRVETASRDGGTGKA
jgi:hypothetical protein